MVSTAVAEEFLSHRRLALVGASHDPSAFSVSVYRELKAHGYDMVPVNPRAEEVEGDRCHASVADLPDGIEGAIVMVPADSSATVVQQCIDRGVPRVWLHQGAGPSSVSDEAVALCRDNGVEVVEGACPMMFLEDAAWIHRAHRWGRRVSGHLTE
ncbi:MAG: CoA-binding protein [Acidimicrobiales bacterium]